VLKQADSIAARQKRRFRFKNPLVSIDSSTIDLCLSMFDWAKFRRKKGAVKLHLMLNHQGCLPQWAYLTNGKVHDVKVAQTLEFEPETVVAMDRGYVDYELFGRWTDRRVWFVTRPKTNMRYRAVKNRSVPQRGAVLRDQEILLTGVKAKEKCPNRLRRIVVWDSVKNKELVLLTNHMNFAASTIGRIYKDRWQIELFFKALKQNLKIKTFVGTSENAVKIQIWTALLCMLVLRILQMRSTFGWSLSNLSAMLRFNLLTYRELWSWLNKPFETPAVGPPGPQLMLF
jgi:IS4 transposase